MPQCVPILDGMTAGSRVGSILLPVVEPTLVKAINFRGNVLISQARFDAGAQGKRSNLANTV